MKLEDQVITLQQAQRLKELGVKQESYFSWYVATDCNDDPSLNRSGFHCPTCGHPRAPYFAEAAFTVAELGQLLTDPSGGYGFTVAYNHPTWNFKEQGWAGEVISSHLNEAEARGAFLIHLLESKLITAEEVNERL